MFLLIFVGLCISQMCLGLLDFSLLTIITSSFNLTLDPHLSFSWLHVYAYFFSSKRVGLHDAPISKASSGEGHKDF